MVDLWLSPVLIVRRQLFAKPQTLHLSNEHWKAETRLLSAELRALHGLCTFRFKGGHVVVETRTGAQAPEPIRPPEAFSKVKGPPRDAAAASVACRELLRIS